MSAVLPSLFQKAIDENFIQAQVVQDLLLGFDAKNPKDLPLKMLLARHLPESFILKYLGERHRLAPVSFQDVLSLQRDALSEFPEHLAKAYQCIPLAIENKRCAIAVAEEKSAEDLNQLSLALNLFVYPKITTRLHLELGFARLFDVWPPVESALWLEKEGLLSAHKTDSNEGTTEVAVPFAEQMLARLSSSCDHAALFTCSQQAMQLQSLWSRGHARTGLQGENVEGEGIEWWWKTLRQGKPFFGAFPLEGSLRQTLGVTPQTTVYLLPVLVQETLIGALMTVQEKGGLSPQVISDAHRSHCRLAEVWLSRRLSQNDVSEVRAFQKVGDVTSTTISQAN